MYVEPNVSFFFLYDQFFERAVCLVYFTAVSGIQCKTIRVSHGVERVWMLGTGVDVGMLRCARVCRVRVDQVDNTACGKPLYEEIHASLAGGPRVHKYSECVTTKSAKLVRLTCETLAATCANAV